MIYYNEINDWKEYREYLEDIVLEETKLGVKKEDIKIWHEILQGYMKEQPNEKTVGYFFEKLGFEKEAINEIQSNIEKIQENKQVLRVIDDLYEKFFDMILRESNTY